MGAVSHEKLTYWQSVVGQWGTKVSKDTPNAYEHIISKGINAGQKAYYTLADAIQGFILSIHAEKSDFGSQLRIKIKDDDDETPHIITIPLKKRQGLLFLNYLPNIELSKRIRISSSQFRGDDGKDRNWLFVSIEVSPDKYVNVPELYPKFEGLPELDEKIVNEEKVYDATSRYKALLDTSADVITQLNEKHGELYFWVEDRKSNYFNAEPEKEAIPDDSSDFLTSDPIPGVEEAKAKLLNDNSKSSPNALFD